VAFFARNTKEGFMPTPAKSIDSYKDALYEVLDYLKPKNIIEWGPGISTGIMALYPSVVRIDTIEHDREFSEKAKIAKQDNVNVMYEPNPEMYPLRTGNGLGRYDLAFVDGRDRETCLIAVKPVLKEKSVVILHDAERGRYRNSIDKYTYKIWQDNGNTVVLTDNEVAYKDLRGILCSG
jgi:predicted O-methyltransferase YrrM